MTQQNDLFSSPPRNFGSPAKNLVRRTDPVTSVEAAESIDTTAMEYKVYQAIKSFGPAGCISSEVVELFPEHGVQTVSPRYRPLLNKGFIELTGEKRKGKYGRNQMVMRAKQ